MVIFVVVHLNKFPLFSKELITLIKYFISLFVSVIFKPSLVIYSLFYLPICLSRKSFSKSLAISLPCSARFYKILSKIGMLRITPPDFIILNG